MKNEGKWDGTTPFFFWVPKGDSYFYAIYDYTFDGSEIFQLKNYNLPAGKYNSGYVAATFDDPFDVKFKLNTNIFKSQQGDIADGVESASTAELTGKFADGTDFDYNLVVV